MQRRSCHVLAARPIASISSAPAKGLFGALPIGDGGTKGGATCRFKAETAMLAEWLPQPFPSRRDREFESVFLQRRVRCEPLCRGNSPSCVEKPRFSAGVRAGASGAVGRDAQDAARSGLRAVISLSRHIPVPHRR